MSKRILVSDATSYKSVIICEFIKKTYEDIEIYTCDSRKASKLFHTKYVNNHFVLKSSIREREDYINEILNIIKEYNINIFFPINSLEMDILLPYQDKFGGTLSYWGGYQSFKILNEKDKLSDLCKRCGVKMPETYYDVSRVKFPAVIKPVVSSAAKGVRYCNNEYDLEESLKGQSDLSKITIQKYIKGTGVGFSVFALNGVAEVGYSHRRILEYPISGGSSTYRETYSDARLIEIAGKILAETKWSGFAMFEFKLTPANEIYLIEVNPRIWGSINQGLQNGVNYFKLLLGEAPVSYNKNIYTFFSPLIYLSLLKHLLKGEVKPLLIFLKNIPDNKSDISIFHDFRAWMGTLIRLCQGA